MIYETKKSNTFKMKDLGEKILRIKRDWSERKLGINQSTYI